VAERDNCFPTGGHVRRRGRDPFTRWVQSGKVMILGVLTAVSVFIVDTEERGRKHLRNVSNLYHFDAVHRPEHYNESKVAPVPKYCAT
jgi:hypothetical protein